MSKLLDYLNEYGIQSLIDEYKIDVKTYDRGDGIDMYVLSYNHIESPKNDITNLCRGCIVTFEDYTNSFEYLCRPFDRFFNYNEGHCVVKENHIGLMTFYPKLDGSIIKLWFNYYTESWVFSTNGTAFAESDVQDWNLSFLDLVKQAVPQWESLCERHIDKLQHDFTYIFELTSPLNRVVRKYDETKMTLLAVRENKTGIYVSTKSFEQLFKKHNIEINEPLFFESIDELKNSIKGLENLDEGYVGYWGGEPLVKFKSSAYVAAHHIRGEGLTHKRIIDLIIVNEHHEYLAVFPEDQVYFEPYVNAYQKLYEEVCNVVFDVQHIKDKKEMALTIQNVKCKGLVFSVINNQNTFTEAFQNMTNKAKHHIIEQYI